jgi:hypothetical protein
MSKAGKNAIKKEMADKTVVVLEKTNYNNSSAFMLQFQPPHKYFCRNSTIWCVFVQGKIYLDDDGSDRLPLFCADLDGRPDFSVIYGIDDGKINEKDISKLNLFHDIGYTFIDKELEAKKQAALNKLSDEDKEILGL